MGVAIITFERSFDYEWIRSVLTHKSIYRHISDDGSPEREEYRPVESEAVWYVAVKDCDELLGLFMFVPQNAVTWEVHTALLPNSWGARSIHAALELPDWIWEHTGCRRIVTNVPSPNRLALRFAVDAGMTIYGVNRHSYLKRGVLCDQVCLGLSCPQEMPIPGAETGPESIAGGLDAAAHAPASPGETLRDTEMHQRRLVSR